jgi:hypothetical protein
MNDLGQGIYTLSDAARLVRADASRIKRWLYGYQYTKARNETRRRYRSGPLWTPQYDADELGEKVIGFKDLMELRIVREFVARGVPLIVVRHCLEQAREMFGSDYPFTRQRFLTDGETIFHEVIESEALGHEAGLLDLRKR